MIAENTKQGTTHKLDTSELRRNLNDGPVPYFTTLAYGLRAGSAPSYPLLPAALLTVDLPGETPYWRIEFYIERSAQALGFDLVGDVIVGRGLRADIDLDFYDALEHGVSRSHALLRPSRQYLYILDADSKNGVYVNGVRISRGQARTLHDDTTLTLGKLTCRLKIIDHATLDTLRQRLASGEVRSRPQPVVPARRLVVDRQSQWVKDETIVTSRPDSLKG